MLSTIQRYLALRFLGPLIGASSFFVIFLVTFQMFKVIRIVIAKDVEWYMVFEIMGHIAISILPLAIPIAAYFAAMYTTSRLSSDSELVAMRSFGLNKLKLYYPFFFITASIALTMYCLNRNIIPLSKTRFKNQLIKLTSRGVLSEIKPGQFFVDIPGVTLFANEVLQDGALMKDVFIHMKDKKSRGFKVIMAQEGELIKEQESENEVPTIRLHLSKGNLSEISETGRDIEKVLFDKYHFPIFDQNLKYDFMTKDNMRTSRELRSYIQMNKGYLADLTETGKARDQRGLDNSYYISTIYKSKLEFLSRINIPLQLLIFSLLGFCSGVKKGRGRTSYSGLIGFGTVLLYYAIFFSLVSMTKKGQLMPEVTVFLPSLICFLISYKFYKGLDWAQ